MTDPRNRAERPGSRPGVDAERLAALLDGRLDERQRAEAVERLASSDDEFEAFVDALAVTRELEAEEAAAGVTPLRPPARKQVWQRPGSHWAAIAAVLVGLALLPVLWNRSRAPDIDDPGRFPALLEAQDAGLPAGWNPRPWGTTRGPGDPLTPEARAVRLGVRLTDLEVAVESRDPRTAELAADVVTLLEGVPATGPLRALYRGIGERAGEPPDRMRPLLEQGRSAVAGVTAGEQEYLETGAWAEAGRVAVERRDTEFFRARATRGAIDRTMELPALPESARAAVERVRGAATVDGAPDWGTLGRALGDLLRVLGS